MSNIRRRTPPIEASRMRMDRRPNATRISDPSHPAGKRKEIDNVMKKARQQPPNEYWDKKLLEAEDKDPGRWKHSAYAKIYVNGARRSRSRSPVARRTPLSPQRSSRHHHLAPARTPERYHRPRSPPPRYNSRERMVKPKEMVRPTKSRPMSPPMHHKQSARTPSASSCSDDSCSVYSSDEGARRGHKSRPERYPGPVNRIRSISSDDERVPKKKSKTSVVSPKRKLKRPTSPVAKSSRRQQVASPTRTKKKEKTEKLKTRIKVEGEKRRRSPSSGSEDSSADDYTFPALNATTRITLSERFGKIAQWSNDRKYDMNDMKITKDSVGGDRSAVMVEQQIRETPQERSFARPEGHYPEELMAHSSAQAMGLQAWDDVRVRFDYYKSKGYLRDLSLPDYQAWENWWYRYQEWLKQERYFEMVGRNMMRRRRKKIPIQQRLN